MLSSVYLTGGTIESHELVSQGPESDWRTIAMTKLTRYGLKVVNPLEFAFMEAEGLEGAELIYDITEMRVKRALDLIDQCDALLANIHRSSYAAAMEIFYAHRRGKMVTVVGQSPFSPWVISHSQARFGDIDHAIDYLVEEQPLGTPLPWAMQYENHLAERYEQFPLAGEPDYQFLGGEIPVLVIAPHATAYWRDGEFHEPDTFTGCIAAVLNRMSGAHALFTNYCCVADPCWYSDTPFKRALGDIVKAGQVGLAIILLGSTWQEAPGLQVFASGPSKAYSDDLVQRLKLSLSILEPVATESYDHLVKPIVQFVSEELAIPLVVIKMHKRYRMPRLQPESFRRIVGILSSFALEQGRELLRSRS
ncbi:MAG TPA: hypothetical protein V6D17_02545 [Candidatus Obscuribacterales bacterium]